MLTKKQGELLRFIHQKLTENGVPPSFDEMKDALDLRSKSGIHRLILALEERGFIRRLPNRARALEVLRLPESTSGLARPGRQRFTPSVIEGDLGRVRPPAAQGASTPQQEVDDIRSIAIPVMGRIAAGTPRDALESRLNTINISPDFLSHGVHYALEVRGDSMVEAGIFDGDTVVIKKQETADTGDIVVALIDDETATLKRLRKRGNSVALEAANPTYETQIYGSDRVRIQGKLVSLIRRY